MLTSSSLIKNEKKKRNPEVIGKEDDENVEVKTIKKRV